MINGTLSSRDSTIHPPYTLFFLAPTYLGVSGFPVSPLGALPSLLATPPPPLGALLNILPPEAPPLAFPSVSLPPAAPTLPGKRRDMLRRSSPGRIPDLNIDTKCVYRSWYGMYVPKNWNYSYIKMNKISCTCSM